VKKEVKEAKKRRGEELKRGRGWLEWGASGIFI